MRATTYAYTVWGDLRSKSTLLDRAAGSNRSAATYFAYDLQGGLTRQVDAKQFRLRPHQRVDASQPAVGDTTYVAEQIAKGNFVDRAGKDTATAWLSAQGVPDSPFGLVSIGRQFPEIGNLAKYRMPDLLVRFRPCGVFVLDATIGTKTASKPQVRDPLNYGASKWGNVTPTGTQWITNPNLVLLPPRTK